MYEIRQNSAQLNKEQYHIVNNKLTLLTVQYNYNYIHIIINFIHSLGFFIESIYLQKLIIS